MGKNKNTIKINGHLYDATSGARLHHGSVLSPPTRKSVDGVVAHAKPGVQHHAPVAKLQSAAKAPVAKRKARGAAPAAHRPVDHSHTLMRHAVKKPGPHKHLKVQGQVMVTTRQPQAALATKAAAHKLHQKRLKHAQQVAKSSAVSRFGSAHVASAPTPPPKTTQAHHAPTPVRHHKKPDMFEQALQRATSHLQPAPKKRLSHKQRIVSYSALAVTSLVIVGALASQSAPGIKVRMASAKAGFAAGLPGYQPAGYHLGDLDYSAGVVSMNFKSNSDQARKFAITQKASQWDSSTLRELFVQNTDKNYQTVDVGGRTVYIYDQNNATWVDQGVWYQVQSTGALSNSQLVDIAKSL